MHRYPWIDLRALGAQAGAVAADAARAGACRFVVAEAERDVRAARRNCPYRRRASQRWSTTCMPLAGVRVRIDGAADFDAVRTAIARHALVLIDYALATTVPLERLLASVREAACRIVVSLADPHGAAYLARKHAQSPVDIAFARATPPRCVACWPPASCAREPLKLKTFEVQRVEPLGTGLHAVIDGCSQLDGEECVLAGASATSMLLVVAAGAAHPPAGRSRSASTRVRPNRSCSAAATARASFRSCVPASGS